METKTCQNCKQDFTIEPEDFLFYEKMQVPAPTFCPQCRMIRRLLWRNEGLLFRRQDGYSGKEVFSGFAPEAKVVTYENSFWYGDGWNPFATGREYDFSRPFFSQFKELLSVAPIPARSVFNLVNSDYCNEASEMKNSYLCFNTDFVENSAYLRKITHIKECFDINDSNEDELCYESVLLEKCYSTYFSVDCDSCVDVWFSKGLRGCTNCFGCVNLTKKSYCYFNVQYSKEEYQEKIAQHVLTSYSGIQAAKKQARAFWLDYPVKFNHTSRTYDSNGERIYDSKNVKDSHTIRGGENLRYCQDLQAKTSNCYDYSVWGVGTENIYESQTCGLGCYNLRFSYCCWENARDLEYCVYCVGSKNCFGCVGLYKQEYCIFNKQYSKEEYSELRNKIVEQMKNISYIDAKGREYRYGEFFPFDLSPHAYNETLDQDFFPLTEAEALEKGYGWREPNNREYQATQTSQDLPDDIRHVPPTITNEILECMSCHRAYRIIPAELSFFNRVGLPLPRMCHMCRYMDRAQYLNPPVQYHRACMCEQDGHTHSEKCSNEFESSYAPERPDIVYCEQCYQQETS